MYAGNYWGFRPVNLSGFESSLPFKLIFFVLGQVANYVSRLELPEKDWIYCSAAIIAEF